MDPGIGITFLVIGLITLFIMPVSGDTGLGHLIHITGSNLNLDSFPHGTDDRGMQRLVHIRLGATDIILEFGIDGFPQGMDNSQGFITMGNRVQNDSECKNIVNLFKR